MNAFRRNFLARYGFALLMVVGAISLFYIRRAGMWAASLVYLAVFLGAWFGGLGPGLFATGAGAAITTWIAARGNPARYFEYGIGIGLFIAGGVLISFVVRSMDLARRRAEEHAREAARQSERLRTTLRSIGDAVIVADEGGRVVSLNPVAEALTGWTDEEAAGLRLVEVFRVEGAATGVGASDSTERTFRDWGMGGVAGHSSLVSRDGSRRPIDETAATIRGADGKVRGAVLVFRDVSERRDAERRVTAAEARFRAFMDYSPVVAFIKDDYGRYVWGNAGWGRLHPGGVESALGKTDFELWPAETASRFREGDRLALESEIPMEVDEPSVAHDGAIHQWISLKFRIGDGDPPLIGGISVDGTERIAAERALRDSEERYRTLFESNPLPMWVYDVETLGFLAVNAAAVRRYGYTRDEFLAMRITDIR
ncbi:MAG TPA: PAS domain S-box protein, partial [Isosphaeraceae bacterium]